MDRREPLSVAVITLDEERNLGRCLESVSWADEVVVVDSGSTDRTLEIARDHGARVHHRSWSGFVDQKNAAIDLCSHDWILSLDADEWLSLAGGREVGRTLVRPRADAFAFNRLTAFSGAFLRHAWSPDWQLRLFRRGRGRFFGGRVHESLQLEAGCRVDRLRERLLHGGYRSVQDYLTRLDRYTSLAARDLHDRGRRCSWARLLFSPPATFLKLFLLRRAFLDGARGTFVSFGSAHYVAVKYAKLWELERGASDGTDERSATARRDGDGKGGLSRT